MFQQLSTISLLIVSITAFGNDVDFLWYDSDNLEHYHQARQPFDQPELVHTVRIAQKFPILWQVKFETFPNLGEVFIDSCGVKKIQPGAFNALQTLTSLSLTSNEIREIKDGVFNYIQVQHLNLSHNNLQALAAKAFDHMPTLESINLNFNQLRQWNPNWFFNSTTLKSISITHNFIDNLPARAFRNFANHTASFYFSYNKIATIHRQVFDNCGHFDDLFLDWNEIQKLDGHTFARLNSSRVEKLNLDGDTLRCLSEEFIGRALEKMKHVSVLGNPLKCECVKELKKREISSRVLYNETLDCDQ